MPLNYYLILLIMRKRLERIEIRKRHKKRKKKIIQLLGSSDTSDLWRGPAQIFLNNSHHQQSSGDSLSFYNLHLSLMFSLFLPEPQLPPLLSFLAPFSLSGQPAFPSSSPEGSWPILFSPLTEEVLEAQGSFWILPGCHAETTDFRGFLFFDYFFSFLYFFSIY